VTLICTVNPSKASPPATYYNSVLIDNYQYNFNHKFGMIW
jgi:hypothetical protein